MNHSKFTVGINKGASDLKAIISGISQGNVSHSNGDFGALIGAESMTPSLSALNSSMGFNQKNAVESFLESDDKFVSRANSLKDMISRGGMESFSMQLDQGNVARQKAASIQLNARSNRQWDAAERLFPTVVVPYDQETLELPIDIAGVGSYSTGANPNEAFENLRPIASVLADSSFSAGDDLKLVPVLPASASTAGFDAFVSADDWTPWDVTYDDGDLMGRQTHKTSYLAIKKINNLLSLCRAPGAPAPYMDDEIEASSINVRSILLKVKTKDGEGFVTLDTSTMSGRACRPSTGQTSDEKRQLTFPVVVEVSSLKDKNGATTDLFKSLTDTGLKVYAQFELQANYQRSTRTWSPSISPVSLAYVVTSTGERLTVGSSKVPETLASLITAQALEASVHGIILGLQHANTNRSRYGMTVVYASVVKSYSIAKRQPISIKYPMSDEDNNAVVLDKLVRQMDTMVCRNMSHDAFKTANAHFDYLYDNNGAKIVNINDDSASILPGQHFLKTTAVSSKFELATEVSTLDSKDAMANIQAVLVNKITDVITALRVNSNVSALKEIDGREEEYVVVAHASLAPFLITTGDYRTFGSNIKYDIVETNIDSEVGKFWVVPKSQTKDGDIDIFGGMGICVAKELLVIEGTVNQADRQYRMLITAPAYQHHALTCVAGRAEITDIADLLGDKGLISTVNKHLVSNSGTVATTTATTGTQEVDVNVPNP